MATLPLPRTVEGLREQVRSWLARHPRPVAKEYEPEMSAYGLLERPAVPRPADDQQRPSLG